MIVLTAFHEMLLEHAPDDTHLKDLTDGVRAWTDTLTLPSSTGIALAAVRLMEAPIQRYCAAVAQKQRIRPRDSLLTEPTLPTGRVMQALDLTGPAATFGSWPAGGWHALAWAIAQLVLEKTTHMLVGSWVPDPQRLQWLLLTTDSINPRSATHVYWIWQQPEREASTRKSLLDFARFLQEGGPSTTFEVFLPDGGLVITGAAIDIEREK